MNRFLTFSQRASKRAPGLAAAVLAPAWRSLASCSSDYKNCTDCPGSPALIPGSFVLVAVEGKILPYSPPNSNVTFLAGDCVTTPREVHTQDADRYGNGGNPVRPLANGFVLAFNKRIGDVFQFAPSYVQATALITGNGFVLTYQGLNLTFERVNRLPRPRYGTKRTAPIAGRRCCSAFVSGGAGNRTPVRS